MDASTGPKKQSFLGRLFFQHFVSLRFIPLFFFMDSL